MKRNEAQLLKNIMRMTAACIKLHNFHEIQDVLLPKISVMLETFF